MTLLTVVRDVCATVGVTLPTSVFGSINTDRTAQEMLALANEVAQRIAYDTRDWTMLKVPSIVSGADGTAELYGSMSWPLPSNYKRMLLTANVRRTDLPAQPLQFMPDSDQWLERRLSASADASGEWIIQGGKLFVNPALSAGVDLIYLYLDKNCIALASGGHGDRFMDDTDSYRLDERVLKLGMIWQWKAQKGAPYAEDMGSFSDALALAMGKDSPAPTIVGRLPLSQAHVQSMSVTAPTSWPLDNWP